MVNLPKIQDAHYVKIVVPVALKLEHRERIVLDGRSRFIQELPSAVNVLVLGERILAVAVEPKFCEN